MHRQHSLQPFSRHYSHTKNPFMDLLEVDSDPEEPLPIEDLDQHIGKGWTPLFPCPRNFTPTPRGSVVGNDSPQPGDAIRIHHSHLKPMSSMLRAYKLVRSKDLLHYVSFVTVHDYLFLLRGIGQVLANTTLGRSAMFYLAAAVSDFFLPQQKMVRLAYAVESSFAEKDCAGPAQDPVGQGLPSFRNGFGTQNSPASCSGMEQQRLHNLFQGQNWHVTIYERHLLWNATIA